MSNLKVLLTFSEKAKSIPYDAMDHDDGTHNHGFTSLKGHLERLPQVAEARGVPAFQSLLSTLNGPHSPFFSVACEKAFNSGDGGHWASGFVEFAFNFAELIGDASNYFSLFYHFNHDAGVFISGHDVQFHWIIQPARFDDGACDGFTCSVWFTTAQYPTAVEARAQWDAAVDCLSAFIDETAPYDGAQIYASG
jgi:hypothetical protein